MVNCTKLRLMDPWRTYNAGLRMRWDFLDPEGKGRKKGMGVKKGDR